jgi:lipid-A-disaccharide synthase-like uncharacterized protein
MMNAYLVYGVGFLGQILFFSRTILQWFKSENEGEIISPVIFWQLSLVASQIMLLYGILRNDFAIMLGQFIVYYIYVRNLQLKNAWKKMYPLFRLLIILVPFVIFLWLLTGDSHNFHSLFTNEDIPVWLIMLGSSGQLIFSFRFVYQWLQSEKEKSSVLPPGFWIISITGSLIIFIYAIFRLDPVLFISNLISLFVYLRNLLLDAGKSSLLSRINNSSISNLSKKISDRIN